MQYSVLKFDHFSTLPGIPFYDNCSTEEQIKMIGLFGGFIFYYFVFRGIDWDSQLRF